MVNRVVLELENRDEGFHLFSTLEQLQHAQIATDRGISYEGNGIDKKMGNN